MTKEWSTSRKRAVALIFGGCEWWWWPKKGQTPENEHNCSFSEVVGGSGCQGEINLLKMSCCAHFQGLWVVVVAKERSNPRK